MDTVFHKRGLRRVIAAAALTAVAALAAPGTATAQEMPTVPFDPNMLHFVPALLGAAAAGSDEAREARADLLAQLSSLLAQGGLPVELQSSVKDIADFVGGSAAPGGPGAGGVEIPTDGPPISQFLYPTVGFDCMGPGQNSVATALAVAGPAGIPLPGPKAGETAFVFTALGTGGSTGKLARDPLTVAWFNLDTLQGGQQPLDAKARINPDGPTTLSAIVKTGPGRILASITGNIENKGPNGTITCGFGPTVGFIFVP